MQAESAKQTNQTKQPIEMHKKYKTRNGLPVRILCTDRKYNLPVVALFTNEEGYETFVSYSSDGEYARECGNHYLDLIEVQPWDDFKIDDPVIVSNGGVNWHKGHFAGISVSGFPMTFNGHRSSFTAEHKADVTAWKYCKKPDQE